MCTWLVWLAAALTLLVYLSYMADMLVVAGIALLWWSVPARRVSSQTHKRVILHADGSALWGEEPGVWLPGSWRTQRYNVIQFQGATRRRFLWISAGNNHSADYRHLGLWCRFPPQQTDVSANDSHLRK